MYLDYIGVGSIFLFNVPMIVPTSTSRLLLDSMARRRHQPSDHYYYYFFVRSLEYEMRLNALAQAQTAPTHFDTIHFF